MTRNHKLVVGAAGAMIVALVAWLGFGSGGGNKDSGQNKPVPVVAGAVTARDVPLYLAGIGTVQAYNTVTIRVRVDGELVNIAFREGQDVKKGDLLAQIDPRPYQAALDNALGILAKDEATLANAKRDLVRYQDTAAKGYSSRQQLDTQAAMVTSLTANIQADQATVENARVQLGYTTIVSPLEGRTGIRLIDQGNIVHASETNGLVVITQVQPIAAIFTLPQDKLASVMAAAAQGPLPVLAFGRDDSTSLGEGSLELVDNQIDPATGTIRLKARFPNAQRSLWPGEFINVRLQIGQVHDGLTIASTAVQRGANGPFTYVIKPDGTVDARQLEIGQEDRGEMLVTKGLKAGEKVVVDGQLRLQPGAAVQLVDRNGNPIQTGALGPTDGAGPINAGGSDAQGPAIR